MLSAPLRTFSPWVLTVMVPQVELDGDLRLVRADLTLGVRSHELNVVVEELLEHFLRIVIAVAGPLPS